MKNETKSSNLVLLNRIIFFLSLLGIAMAVYVLQSWLRQSSVFCLNGGGCTAVQKSPYSYPFGIPVPAVGLVGYTILAISAFLRTMNHEPRTMNILFRVILGMATFGAGFVSWFTYTEIFLIGGVCTWCAVSAVNMFVIFTLSLISLRIEKTGKL